MQTRYTGQHTVLLRSRPDGNGHVERVAPAGIITRTHGLNPKVRYTKSGNVNIAYQVVGDGPLDLVLVPGWVSNIEVFWEEPSYARFLNRLASFSRLMLFDKRGTGLSDRVTDTPTLEERMDDVRAVMDAVGSEKAALLGYSEGGPMCVLFSTTYPERTISIIMIGSYARRLWAPDYPDGADPDRYEVYLESIEREWGGPVGIDTRAPTLEHDERFRAWWARMLRQGATPATAQALTRMNSEIDVRNILPSIRVPTLILHATGDRTLPISGSRYMAERIPNAKFVELPTKDHLPWVGCPDMVVSEVEEFLTGVRHTPEIDRIVCTIMFTDIVESTRLAAEMGDLRWRDLLEAHHAAVRRELSVYRGKEIKTTGDGFHATFDGPARAIQCASAVLNAVGELGLGVRIGLHTGECQVKGDSLEGLAIHIAARVSGTAKAGEIVVSSTVKDLVAGSGISFVDAGAHELKGVPDEWQLFSVQR